MSTLSAIFRLTDAYTPAINRIYNSTTAATSSITRASAATDNLSNRFTSSSSSTSALTSKITGLVAAYVSLESVKKFMDISDEYTNTNSKLSLITNSLTQQKQLQNEIFAAADRARGSYSTMADTVAKLGITAGSQFGNTENIVKFTETMQKMFKIGGTSTANQSGAMLQLQQAIGLGKLQGQDLRILAEDAPLTEAAIAKYMGKSVGEIKQLGTDGKITSQILINSILNYSSTVDSQMSKMSYTWGDYWNMIKNGATKAFGGVFAAETSVLGSNSFKNTVNGIIGSFTVLANVANKVLGAVTSVFSFISTNWSTIAPIIVGITAELLIYNATAAITSAVNGIAAISAGVHGAALMIQTGATFAATTAQWGLNAALFACPLTWIVLAIIAVAVAIYLVVEAVDKATGATTSALGVVIGVFSEAIAGIENVFFGLWNMLVEIFVGLYNLVDEVASFLNNVFTDPVGSVIRLFSQMGDTILSIFEGIDKAIDAVLNTNFSAGIASLRTQLAAATKSAAGTAKTSTPFKKLDASTYSLKANDYSTVWNNAYKTGTGIDSSISKALANLNKASTAATTGTTSNPTTVTGTGTSGAVTVNIADQDLQYLRDLAEKDYVNKFSTAVLSPKISVKVSNATSTQSNDELAKTISGILSNEVATSAEGSYT
jgi:tape measure domain-containing protein